MMAPTDLSIPDLSESVASKLLHEADVRFLENGRPDRALSRVAGTLKVASVSFAGGCTSGHTNFLPDGTVAVSLPGQAYEARTVFAFAHELAHVALRRYESELPAGTLRRGDNIERLCDRIASALIMPKAWMECALSSQPSLAEIFSVADQASISPTAVAIRARSLGRDVTFVRFRRLHNGRWILASTVGIPAVVRRLCEVDVSLSEYLNYSATECPHETAIAICNNGASIEIRAQVTSHREAGHLSFGGVSCSPSREGWGFHRAGAGAHGAKVLKGDGQFIFRSISG